MTNYLITMCNNNYFILWLYSNKWRTQRENLVGYPGSLGSGARIRAKHSQQGETSYPRFTNLTYWQIYTVCELDNRTDSLPGETSWSPPWVVAPLPRYISTLGRGVTTWPTSRLHDDVNEPGRQWRTTALCSKHWSTEVQQIIIHQVILT